MESPTSPSADDTSDTSVVKAPAASRSSGHGVEMDMEKIAAGVRLILEGVGEDPNREGLLETPARLARMYKELLAGTGSNPGAEITCTLQEDDTDEYILVKDIPFASTCEHHMVPFVGLAHVAYIPNGGKITGLSKLARVVEVASKRLQVQERMTMQIADAVEKHLDALGVAVILEAEHFCMSIRGIKKPGSKTVTSVFRGILKNDKSMRADLVRLIKG